MICNNLNFYVAKNLTIFWIKILGPKKKVAVAEYIINVIFDPNGPKPNDSRFAGVICGICRENNANGILGLLREAGINSYDLNDVRECIQELAGEAGCVPKRNQRSRWFSRRRRGGLGTYPTNDKTFQDNDDAKGDPQVDLYNRAKKIFRSFEPSEPGVVEDVVKEADEQIDLIERKVPFELKHLI